MIIGITKEKHPVSLLNEYCVKRKWDLPVFNATAESGIGHEKSFTTTVSTQNVHIYIF